MTRLPMSWGAALALACASEPGPGPVESPEVPPAKAPVVLPEPLAPPAAPPPRAVQLDQPGLQAVKLAHPPATSGVRIQSIALGEVPDTGGPLPLSATWEPHAEHAQVRSQPSPVRFDHKSYRARPPGTRLVDASTGAVLPYRSSLLERGQCGESAPCWEVHDGAIHFGLAEGATVPFRLELVHDDADRDAQRRSPAASGLSDLDFVRWSATIDHLTREALLLPAPSEMRWTVPVEPGVVLRFGFGAPPPRAHAGPVKVGGQVTIDDQPVWSTTATTGTPWTEHTIDLSPWAGQTVSLAMRSTADEPGTAVAFAEPAIAPTSSENSVPRRIVVVGIDTLRLDHLGLHGAEGDFTPGLDQWGAGAVVFDNAWAPAPRTRPSFRSALTGRWPLDAIGAPPLSRWLADAGFSTAGIVANVHLQPHLGFADGAGWWDYHDSDDAGPQVDRALSWLRAHAHEDSFLFLHLMDPHIFYLAPEPFTDAFTAGLQRGRMPDRYNRWTMQEQMRKDRVKPHHQEWVAARYAGEVRYLDQELSRLLAAVDALPGDTLVVMLSDHGEELWDHGGFEHNHSLHPELMRTMLWMRPPKGWSGGPQRVAEPVSLIDVVPTILDVAGVRTEPGAVQGLSLAAWLDPGGQANSSAFTDRPLQLGHMMFAREQWGVLHAGWTYTLETASGVEAAYEQSTDPKALTSRLSDAPLDSLRSALSDATGWPVGQGWRVQLKQATTPFSLVFSHPVSMAGVIDPEASRSRRANLEWGEVPPVLPADVAEVRLSTDQTTVHVRPGSRGQGTLYILGATAADRASVRSEAPTYTVSVGQAMLGSGPARIAAGTLIIPQDTEAGLLAEAGDPRLIEALRAMGYIE